MEWKVPEITIHQFKSCAAMSSRVKSHLSESFFSPVYPHCIRYLPDHHLVAIMPIKLTAGESQQSCGQATLHLLNNVSKAQEL